jgi:hypothetical protein
VANTNLFLLIGYGLPAALVVLATRGRLGYGATASSVNDERQETIAPALTKLA